MKLVNESIEGVLKAKSEEEMKQAFDGKKIAFYHGDTDEFEYKGKRRFYSSTPNIASFLRTKDYLVYVWNGKPRGFIEADVMASYINSGYGSLYTREDKYSHEFLNYLPRPNA
jgi:hypothetical protein